MEELTGMGKSIIMVSSEMPEILGMSDRIAVIAEGMKKGEVTGEEANQVAIMKLITGV